MDNLTANGYPKTCTVCGEKAHGQGLCNKHYQRLRKGKDPSARIARDETFEERFFRITETVEGTECRVPKTGYQMHWKGRTRTLRQWAWEMAYGPIPDGWRIARTKSCASGRCVIPAHLELANGWYEVDGYVRNATTKQVAHRVVMEQILGRELLPGETVHHRNGIRNDNRPENLELWVSSQPYGQRVEDLLAWAHEIIERYEART